MGNLLRGGREKEEEEQRKREEEKEEQRKRQEKNEKRWKEKLEELRRHEENMTLWRENEVRKSVEEEQKRKRAEEEQKRKRAEEEQKRKRIEEKAREERRRKIEFEEELKRKRRLEEEIRRRKQREKEERDLKEIFLQAEEKARREASSIKACISHNQTDEEKTWGFQDKVERQSHVPKALDLHGLTVNEAIPSVVTFLRHQEQEYVDHHFDERYRFCYIITGRGNHTPDNIAILKPAVAELMDANKLKYKYSWSNDGEMKVDLIGRQLSQGYENEYDDVMIIPSSLAAARARPRTSLPQNIACTIPMPTNVVNARVQDDMNGERPKRDDRNIVYPLVHSGWCPVSQPLDSGTAWSTQNDDDDDDDDDGDDNDDFYEEPITAVADDASGAEESSDEESILAIEDSSCLTLDLRGYRVKEALCLVKEFLEQMDQDFIKSEFNPGLRYCYIITGWGKHSPGFIPKIRPAVLELMKDDYHKLKYQFQWTNEGEMEVDLIGRKYEADYRRRAQERLAKRKQRK